MAASSPVVAAANSNVPPFPLYKDYNSQSFSEGLDSVANILTSRRNILVLAGAGLSVSCGIPDFRSQETGLYSTLDAHGLGLASAEDLFDLETFLENPRPFYRFAKTLYPGTVAPSPSHSFLGSLEHRGRLLRVYTQNIDGLETTAGVSEDKVVHAHGSLRWARCTTCRAKVDAGVIHGDVMSGKVPLCRRRKRGKRKRAPTANVAAAAVKLPTSEVRLGLRRRTPSNNDGNSLTNNNDDITPTDNHNNTTKMSLEESSELCGGVIKPGVTFFGEKLPDKVGKSLLKDVAKVDALIVIGTSLSVAPMSKVLDYLPYSIPRILINRNKVKPPVAKCDDDDEEDFRDGYDFDVCLLGDCDAVVGALVARLGWNDNNDVVTSVTGRARDRTLIFPGALLEGDDDDVVSETNTTTKDVVHCDHCSNEIVHGTIIMKCVVCFDFDLCQPCYRKESKRHFKGKHKFIKET